MESNILSALTTGEKQAGAKQAFAAIGGILDLDPIRAAKFVNQMRRKKVEVSSGDSPMDIAVAVGVAAVREAAEERALQTPHQIAERAREILSERFMADW